MRHSKTLATALLTSWALSACSTVEYIEVTPQCAPPSHPALPSIDAGELWDALGDAEYRQLERYLNALWAFSDEQAALLSVVCGD
jgi:hypothetical protein